MIITGLISCLTYYDGQGFIQKRVTAKPGLWTLDWTVDWTMDWTGDDHYQLSETEKSDE